MRLLMVLIAMGFAFAAAAETPAECKKRLGDEVECFIARAEASRMICSLSVDLALLDPAQSDKARACISESRPKVEPHYKVALNRLSKSPAASTILKDAYATWQTAMSSLYPNPGEMKFQYDARRSAQEQTLDQKMNRLRLEAPGGGKKPPPMTATDRKNLHAQMEKCSTEAYGLRGNERVSFISACLKR